MSSHYDSSALFTAYAGADISAEKRISAVGGTGRARNFGEVGSAFFV